MTELQDVPLHIAIAWVYVRNDDFLHYIDAHDFKELDSLLQDFNAGRASKICPATRDVEEAWSMMKAAAVQGFIVMRGIPFDKGRHINAVGVFGQPYRAERDIHSRPKTIGSDELDSLIIEVGGNELRLRPVNWFRSGRCWWREVEMELSEVVTAFPALSDVRKSPNTRIRHSAHRAAVIKAINELWGMDGWEIIQPKVRHEKIKTWIRSNTDLNSSNPAPVSTKTIDRVFDSIKKGIPN